MKKLKEKLSALKPTKRKLMQLYFALLFNANVQNFFTGRIYSDRNPASTTKQFCAPGINCYSCPGAVAACPLGTLQGAFTASFGKEKTTLFYVGGILLLYAILFGRMICGWACPFGLIQELLYKIRSPKLKKSPVTRILSFFKYVVLVFFVGVVPITYAFRNTPMPAFCKFICPAGTIEGGLALLSNELTGNTYFDMLGPLFTWKFVLMVSIVVSSVFIFRMFCRFLCPLGGLYGLFNKISFFGVKVDEDKCTHCNLCVAHCKVDIKHVADQECIGCGECIDVCPTKAISWKGSKIFLKANQIPDDADPQTLAKAKEKQKKARLTTRIISTVVLAALLIGALIYYWDPSVNIFSPTDPSASTGSTAPSGPQLVIGNQIGNLCPAVDLPVWTADGDTGKTIDPTKTGKLTVVNFWGTWCGSCVAELPFFDQIATEYADRVTVIAASTSYSMDEVPAFISQYYPSSRIIFASDILDQDGLEGFFTTLGGTDAYPHTVILDENGVILYNTSGSMTYEGLKAIIDDGLNN